MSTCSTHVTGSDPARATRQPGYRPSMSRNVRTVAMHPSAVWAVLADGWLYPVWVVGAARMREVDEHWPAVGARLHHSVGIWPLLIDDNTEVLESEPEQLLRLRTRGRPAGEAAGDILLSRGGGCGAL